jgi:hypothetical protein
METSDKHETMIRRKKDRGKGKKYPALSSLISSRFHKFIVCFNSTENKEKSFSSSFSADMAVVVEMNQLISFCHIAFVNIFSSRKSIHS